MEEKKEKQATYIFPNFIAKSMSTASPKVQYESSMLGNFLILISILLTGIYYVCFTSMTWLAKGFIIFNAIAGFLMLSSFLVTTYQQYQQYMSALALQKELGITPETEKPFSSRRITIVRGISAAIESLVIILICWFANFWWLLILLIHPIYMIATTRKFIKKQSEVKK